MHTKTQKNYLSLEFFKCSYVKLCFSATPTNMYEPSDEYQNFVITCPRSVIALNLRQFIILHIGSDFYCVIVFLYV